MTRARHITPCNTAGRIENIRTLIATLQMRALTRSEIGDLLKVGPSGVRKYLADLAGKVAFDYDAGRQYCRLVIGAEEATAYLAQLAIGAAARPASGRLTDFDKAVRDPARHFHILADDEHYAIRLRRAPVVRDPLVAAFFGPHGSAVGVHA